MKIALLLVAVIMIFSAYLYADGDISALKDYKYWDNGKMRGCDIYDTEGHLKAKTYNRPDGTIEKIEKFDSKARRIEVIYSDDKGRLMPGIDGWAAKRYGYDEDGALVMEVTYDENGKMVTRKFFSESGHLVAARFGKDAEIDPYEAANLRLILSNNSRYRNR